jgi:hypothetical protein
MDDRVLSFRVGVVVVTAAIICVILILLFGAVPQVLTPTYTVKVKFPSRPGRGRQHSRAKKWRRHRTCLARGIAERGRRAA